MKKHDNYEFKILQTNEIDKNLLHLYIRDETVNRVWRVQNGKKKLNEVNYNEHWNKEDLEEKSLNLKKTVDQGGVVLVALDQGRVIAFAAIEGRPMGIKHDYHQLSQFHVSSQYRKRGIGKVLFNEVEKVARELQITKLYISSSSSEHTLCFYQRNGCVDAREVDERLSQLEPYDIPLEYVIKAPSDTDI